VGQGVGTAWLGESEHSLDDKNRVFLPRRFLAGLDRDSEGRTTVVVTRGFEGCLFLFSESRFTEFLARLKDLAFAGPRERNIQRLFFANTHRTALDEKGRLLVPDKLKALGHIDREVVLVGVIDRIEVWSKAAWNAFERDHASAFDELGGYLFGPRGDGAAST
jgi:MraZ protein